MNLIASTTSNGTYNHNQNFGNSLHNGNSVFTARTPQNFTYTSATSYMANSIGQN